MASRRRIAKSVAGDLQVFLPIPRSVDRDQPAGTLHALPAKPAVGRLDIARGFEALSPAAPGDFGEDPHIARDETVFGASQPMGGDA